MTKQSHATDNAKSLDRMPVTLSPRKHTPGPWRVFISTSGSQIIGIGELDGQGIADCGFGVWRGGSAEAFANARLIAAAPDLLAELRNMVEVFWGLADDRNGDGGEPPSCIVAARAAIAKAEGLSLSDVPSADRHPVAGNTEAGA